MDVGFSHRLSLILSLARSNGIEARHVNVSVEILCRRYNTVDVTRLHSHYFAEPRLFSFDGLRVACEAPPASTHIYVDDLHDP